MIKKTDDTNELIPETIQNRIEHLERVRQDFVANVSHELRTPLTVIRGYLEALVKQQNEQDDPRYKIFKQMFTHCIRMEDIINDLLLLSSLEVSSDKTESQDVLRIGYMLETICEDAKNISGDKKHKIVLNADPTVLLQGSESELKSLFSNLIVNAVKYTPAGGHIEVHWKAEKNQAVFTVKDTGIGIDAKHIPRLTERFYRVDKGRSRESGGTGLGLAIVKHVLLRHQGELKIASKLTQGSEFSCYFPEFRTIAQ